MAVASLRWQRDLGEGNLLNIIVWFGFGLVLLQGKEMCQYNTCPDYSPSQHIHTPLSIFISIERERERESVSH